MFVARGVIAPAMLLSALIVAPVANGIVIAHLIHDHGVMAAHDDHRSDAARHHHDEDGEPQPDGASDHGHPLALAAAAVIARISSPSLALPSCLAPPQHDSLGALDPRAPRLPVPPSWRAEPPTPSRHSILLL